MARPEKVDEVAQLETRLKKASAVILTDFRGLTVGEISALRSRLREAGVEYRVVKNRLMGIAGRSVGVEGLTPFLEGPTAAAFAADDPVAAAKIIQDFIRQTRKLTVKGSIVAGHVYSDAQTKALADLPSRQSLLTQVVGGIAAPLTGLASALSGLPRKLVYAVDEVRRQRSAT
jgi:large subunit ribosomal protein L10